tara:strand:- start:177 stop:419 length:243 start_codon:yes stop_codon:yes gene_type:complete
MKFNVKDIEFDLNDSLSEEYSLSFEEEIELHDSALGIWDTLDEDDLIEQITELSGWCIKSIDYKSMEDSNTLNNINGATL